MCLIPVEQHQNLLKKQVMAVEGAGGGELYN